jgi:ribosomal-protein-alanine N-acetyltransferase
MKASAGWQRTASGSGRPAPWLETLRLGMRDFVAADFDDLLRLGRDPRVMRYIGNGKPLSRDGVARLLARILGYGALYPDLGIWHTSRRDSGAFVGWFSLKYAGKSPDIEIGYWLVPSAWGRGFATEGAQALADYGFDDLDLDRIIGVTHPDNKASQRVLMKAGLRDSGWGRYYGYRLRLFAAENPYR